MLNIGRVLVLSDPAPWAPTAAEDMDPHKPTYVICKAGIRSMNAATVGRCQVVTC
jgi:rhodanese-related sulfurtransferase